MKPSNEEIEKELRKKILITKKALKENENSDFQYVQTVKLMMKATLATLEHCLDFITGKSKEIEL